MKKIIKKYSPPGLDPLPEIFTLITGSIIALSILITPFATGLNYELTWAKEYPPGGRTISYFSEIIGKGTIGFPVLFAVMICFIVYRYIYLIRTKSIYVTRRLPVWCGTEKLVIVVPVCYVLFCFLLEKLTLIVMFVFYYVLTPEIYLKHNVLYDFIMESLL